MPSQSQGRFLGEADYISGRDYVNKRTYIKEQVSHLYETINRCVSTLVSIFVSQLEAGVELSKSLLK